MIEKIREFANRIAPLNGARFEFSSFPSGAATLHVARNNRLFVLDFSPTRQFGVDEVHEDDSFIASFRFTSDEFEPAAAEMRSIVANAKPIVPTMNGTASGSPERAEAHR